MSAVTIVFPHQLFEAHPSLVKDRPVYLIEESLFFNQYNFHKQKLVFLRAGMKAYESYLKEKGYPIRYIEAGEELADVRKLIQHLKTGGISEIHYADVTDRWLEKRITSAVSKANIKIQKHDSPLFLLTRVQVDEYFTDKRRVNQTDFYIQQRKHLHILVNEKLQPLGDKWTFDAENRLKYPKGKKPPEVKFPYPNRHWIEAKEYINANYPNNYGAISASFIYPTTFEESKAWLNQFLQNRFTEFGEYEDALVRGENILNHSVFSPLLNVGLLTPQEILTKALFFANKNKVPINSLEGFVRQILGWREFIRGVYEHQGTRARTMNYWKFSRKIPKSFWDGTTGIPPIDGVIKKVLATGYCHHIERLMVLGNFMLLCEFDPYEVYRWFMEMFVDAYDWVMVPNVYGMSQFADGGLMATKPYISGSNYLMKMSDFEKGDWQPIWDGLFWRFMHVYRDFFLKNPRLGMLVKTFDKMTEEKKESHIHQAENFLAHL